MGLQAVDSYKGDADIRHFEQKSDAKSAVKLEFELGTQVGYDLETNQFGTQEIVDLDFVYVINPFGIYKSDMSGVQYGDVYGVAEVWGAEVELNILDQEGDKETISTTDQKLTINYENIYGKIVFDPFYLMVASSRKGNHYDRNNGWTFAKKTSRIGANIAHIGYDVPWKGTVNTDFWTAMGTADSQDNYGTESSLGLGMIFGMTEMMFQVGTPFTWEENENNMVDVGFILESNPVGNLTVQAQAFKPFNNEEDESIYFSLGTGYYEDLNENYNIQPFIGFDGNYDLSEETADDERFFSETSIGISLRWNGASGWGYEPLNDAKCNRFSGVTLGSSIKGKPNKDPEVAVVITSFEETDAGLIPNLGYSLVFEMLDVTDTKALGYMITSLGLYTEYNVKDMVTPYLRAIQLNQEADKIIDFEIGVKYVAIPNTIITVSYETDDIMNVGDNKGLLVTEFKVVL